MLENKQECRELLNTWLHIPTIDGGGAGHTNVSAAHFNINLSAVLLYPGTDEKRKTKSPFTPLI